jgi:hypothetical protein
MFDLDSLPERFPTAHFHARSRLMTWHPTGILTNERADFAVEFLETTEKLEGHPFDRYTDMSGYTQIKIEIDHIVRLARRRQRGYKGAPVKSAFFAERIISLSIAQMYAELLMDSPIQVCLFRDRAEAAKWLGVPVSVLKAPKSGR